MACTVIKDGRRETLYCAIVYAMKGGGGVPKQRKCLRIIVLILVKGLEQNEYLVKANPSCGWGCDGAE